MRIGIAKADKSNIHLRARFNEGWRIETPDVLEKLWKDIKDCLKEQNYGEYFAFRRVFGETVAREVGNRGEFLVPRT